MIDFTEAYLNLKNLYEEQERDVIQYQFQQYNYIVNVSYTMLHGLQRQLSITFESPRNELTFLPVRVVKKRRNYLISASLGDYMRFVGRFFENFVNPETGKMSTSIFFQQLSDSIAELTADSLRYSSIHEFAHRIAHARYPRHAVDTYYYPYFFNIVNKKLSNRMASKIYEMYDEPERIIRFLRRHNLTLAFTDDINKARDFKTLFEKRVLELEPNGSKDATTDAPLSH